MNDQSIFGQNFGQLPEDQNNSQHQPDSNDPNVNHPNLSKPKPVTIQFTANGSDYFPIWITNLLLTIVTFGIYGPWAKVRREKFFHQHTIIDGDALDYHGNPIKILIGRIITTVLGLGLYAKEFSTTLAISCAVLLAIIVPFAMQRSIRFRLHNTSYRGLRFGFNGTVIRSYFIATIPVLLVFASFIVPTIFMDIDKGKEPPPWFFVSFFGFALLYPLFHATWRRYAIEHAHFGTAFAKTTLNSWRFVSIYIIAALIIGGLVAVIVGLAIAGGIGAFFVTLTGTGRGGGSLVYAAIVAGVLLFYSAVLSFMPLVTAMLQNLCWNKTTFVTRTNGERVSDFLCDLSTSKFVGLQLKNVILTVLTLGLYRPYAAIATTRAKLQSVGLSDFRFMDDVVANSEKQDSAMGDEAVDMLDFDFSL
jgi:uncharacterized membrane protein YjgN (DUF898 family)